MLRAGAAIGTGGEPCPGLFTGGLTWRPTGGVLIPGYLFRHDGKIDLTRNCCNYDSSGDVIQLNNKSKGQGDIAFENVTAKVKAGAELAAGRYMVATEVRAGNSPWHGNRCYVNLLSPA